MTSRERLLGAMRFQKVDRVPVAPFTLGRLQWGTDACRELLEKTDPFVDVGCGSPFLGKQAQATTRQDGNATTTTIHTPRGDFTRRVARTAITSATVEFPCKSPEDIERLLSVPYEPPEPDPTPFFDLKQRLGEDGMALCCIGDGICTASEWLHPQDFCLQWADNPDLLKRLCAVAAERTNVFVRKLCEAGVDGFRIIGGEYASTQLGPRGFKELVSDLDAELVSIMHEYGAIAYFHNHGPIMGYLEAIAELGVDALDPLEAPPWGDADLAAARQKLGDRVCMVGNLDDMELLEKLDAETVQDIARERLMAAGDRGFILGGTASGTYTEPGARNFIAMVDVAREFASRGI